MRLCLRALRHTAAPAPRKAGAPIYTARRAFSSTPTPWRPATKKDEADELEAEEEDDIDPVELERSMRAALRDPEVDFERTARLQEQVLGSANAVISEATFTPRVFPQKSFWHEEEDDPDLITDELDEDVFDEDDIMSMAHGKLEEFREYREYARIAAWEMPLLSSKWRRMTLLVERIDQLTVIRASKTVRTTHRRRTASIPIHKLHGRIPPGRE